MLPASVLGLHMVHLPEVWGQWDYRQKEPGGGCKALLEGRGTAVTDASLLLGLGCGGW